MRTSGERLGGRPTLVLERRSGLPVRVASIGQAGVISELAERLAMLRIGERDAGPSDYVSSEATPGPGDSDGGDLYPPDR